MIHGADVVITVEQRVRARPEAVFRYFTDAAAYRTWMGDRAELDPRPGGLYRVHFHDGSVAEGRYEHVEPPSRLVFTWGWVASPDVPPGSTRVTIDLRQDGDGTIIHLEHRGLLAGSISDEHAKGWVHYLERLATTMTEGGT